MLVDELGIEPSPELRDLEARILRQDPALDRSPGREARAETDATPETHYAQSDGVHIAYQVLGEGELDIVFVPGLVSHLDLWWEDRTSARFFRRLAGLGRLIMFDKRDTGLSDSAPGEASLQERMDDVQAVMRGCGSSSAVLFGYSEGGPMSILFAATYPERVTSLILGACAGCSSSVLLADFNQETLQSDASALQEAGHDVTTQLVDVSSRESVSSLAQPADELGNVVQVAHTAGVSPVQAPPEGVLAVDLFGVAVVLEEMGRVISAGGAAVVISSMAGYMLPALEPAQDDALANTPTYELLELPSLTPEAVPTSGAAYAIAKRANHLRIQSAAVQWGDRGARVNSISPGIILTPLARTR